MKSKSLPIFIGVFGLGLIIFGTFLPPILAQKILFSSGCLLLLCSSIMEKHTFFAVLQVVALIGSLVAFTSFSPGLKAALPIAVSILALIFFITKGMLKQRENIFGCLGLLFLAAGYAVSNPIVYMLGGIFLSTYSYFSYRRGARIAMLFLVLNIVFTFTSMLAVYRMYF